MIQSVNDFQRPFFIGIAGSGMSALAQYLQGTGKKVSGSDRFFLAGQPNPTKDKLEAEGISCFPQTGEGITQDTDLVVVSTAIEDTVTEVQQAKAMGIPILRRSQLLALIAESRKTIAIGGTSGKSTTSAMLFDMLAHAGLDPSIISGAGLVKLIRQGKIGNAYVGKGEWLVIEADESDGSIVQYKPAVGVLLNIDKDHQEVEELLQIFGVFRDNSIFFIVNQSHPLARSFSVDQAADFSTSVSHSAGFVASGFEQSGLEIRFKVNDTPFRLQIVGKHNMENAVAAVAAASRAGVSPATCAAALENYEGIYRRHQVFGNKKGVWLIDDYAHNPVKCAAAIEACQPVAPKVIAWFQPHGYKPTKFLRDEFVGEIGKALRADDEIWMSEIYYAGGTATKDISAGDLVLDLQKAGKKAFFVEDRNQFLTQVRSHLTSDCVILLMAARDPSLEDFARQVWEGL